MNNIHVKRLESQIINSSNKQAIKTSNKNFHNILENAKKKQDTIKFSKHALNRMDNRNINLNKQEMDRLINGFNKAKEKGVKDVLILIEDKIFIASIDNKTIITTVNKNQLKDNVFTNIDGAVIV